MINQRKSLNVIEVTNLIKTVRKWSILWVLPLIFCASCTRFATKGEQLYLQSKNGETLKLPPHFSKTDEENQHLYALVPQTKKNPVVSVLPPGREDTQQA